MFFNKSREATAYDKLNTEDTEKLMPESDNGSVTSSSEKKSLRTYLPLILQICGVVVAFILGNLLGQLRTSRPIDLVLGVSNYSPMLEDIDIKFDTVHFNGSFLNENVYRQAAGPEVDAAWEALGVDYRPLAVPEHLAERAGIAHDQVKIADKYGGGYPANVEGLHHLHCLNLLRKSLYYNYDYYHDLGQGAFKNDDFIVRKHVTHCLDILRQQLMCTVDIGVLGQVWWGDVSEPHPFTDFNTDHKCRNYDAVRQWAEEHQLPSNAPPDYLELPKPGDRILDSVP